jgi:hypothetical protein
MESTMKAPKTSMLTALLAALIATGCTVNIRTRPNAEPSPPPEEESEDILVSPTHNSPDEAEPRRRTEPTDESVRRTTGTTITRREAPPKPDPDSVKTDESKQETVRRTTGTTITRREDPPKQDPDSAQTGNPPDRPGVGKGRDESKEKYPGNGEAKGLEKEKKTEVMPDSVSVTPPDRPGVGKGRDESKEQYPGKGEATGLEKQQDKNNENPGQEKAKSEEKKTDGKPDSRGNTSGQDKQPEPKQEPVTTKQPNNENKPDNKAENGKAKGTEKQPESKKEAVTSTQPSSDRKPESKRETVTTKPAEPTEPGTSDKTSAATPMLEIPAKELPAPGKCRVWIPGLAERDQAKAGKCDDIESNAPAGSWVLSRPSKDRNVVHVKVIDGRRAGVVVKVLSYEVASGKLIGEGTR